MTTQKESDAKRRGPLQNVRIVHASQSVAVPSACSAMADLGADVIWIESPFGFDSARTIWTAEQDRRNMRSISLNCATPEGKEAFLKLIANTDIFMEASKPGQYDKWGLSDEALWEVNPALTILHCSGFGQTGDPKYVSRAGYDPVAQAYGGMMYINSLPGQLATPILPSVADYYSSAFVILGALSGYIRAKETGKGDSIDLAQYETVLRWSMTWPMNTWNSGESFDREHNHDGSGGVSCMRAFECKDGNQVYVIAIGVGSLRGCCEVAGVPYGEGEIVEPGTTLLWNGTEAGDMLNEKMAAYCKTLDAKEAEDEMAAKGIPASAILRYEDMLEHPHFIARESITKHYSKKAGHDIYTSNIVPRFKNEAGAIWTPAPTTGEDNDDILTDLGYTPEQIAAMYESKTLSKR